MPVRAAPRATRVRVSGAVTDAGVAVIEFDTPGRSLDVVDEELMGQLAEALDELEGSDVRAVVLTSAKEGSFGAGADLEWLPVLAADPQRRVLPRAHACPHAAAGRLPCPCRGSARRRP